MTASVPNLAYATAEPAAAGILPVAGDVVIAVGKAIYRLEASWRGFESEAEGHVFQSFDWVSIWQATIGRRDGVVPHIVTGWGPDGRLLFLLPFGIGRIWGLKVLFWLGGRQADLKGGLFARDFLHLLGEAEWARLWQRVKDHLPPVDLIHLADQPERLGSSPNPFIAGLTHLQPDRTHYTRLKGTWPAYYESKRPSAARREDRRRARKLDALGVVGFEIARDPAGIAGLLERLFAGKAELLARMGVRDPFADETVRAFYRRQTERPYPAGLGLLSALTLNGGPIAIDFGFIFKGRFYYLLSAYDAKFHHASPGTRHLQELMRWCLEQGIEAFDFGVGEQGYKYDWCEEHVRLYATIKGCTAAGRVAAVWFGARARLKLLIKTSTILWPLAQAVRARFGRASNGAPL